MALGRLGAPSGFFSGLSNDMLGEILADTLTASNVDITHCARSDRPTTVAFVKLVNGQATYAFYDEATAGRMLALDQICRCWARRSRRCLSAGSSLVNDPAASTYEALAGARGGTRG